MAALARDFAGKADFVAVYVSEAHAQDEWALYSDVCFDQPTTLEARVDIARQMAARLHGDSIPLVVDAMDNAAERRFAA